VSSHIGYLDGFLECEEAIIMSQQRRYAGREQFWREVVAAWQESGRSVRAFCHSRRLQEASFYAWRRTLRQRDQQRAAAQPSKFVPVRVVPDALLEIVLPTGLVVRVPAATEAATVATLVAALRAASC
jgi:transposase-like protein